MFIIDDDLANKTDTDEINSGKHGTSFQHGLRKSKARGCNDRVDSSYE